LQGGNEVTDVAGRSPLLSNGIHRVLTNTLPIHNHHKTLFVLCYPKKHNANSVQTILSIQTGRIKTSKAGRFRWQRTSNMKPNHHSQRQNSMANQDCDAFSLRFTPSAVARNDVIIALWTACHTTNFTHLPRRHCEGLMKSDPVAGRSPLLSNEFHRVFTNTLTIHNHHITLFVLLSTNTHNTPPSLRGSKATVAISWFPLMSPKHNADSKSSHHVARSLLKRGNYQEYN